MLVHAGAAIERLEPAEARSILDAFDEFAKFDDLLAPEDGPPL